jgi:hypothetical protein
MRARSLDSLFDGNREATNLWNPIYDASRQHAKQEPYNKNLIPDVLRKQLHVPSQAEQEMRRKQFDMP